MKAEKCPLCHRSNRQRSTAQNRSMFGIAYSLIAQGMSEQWGETVTTDYVHEFCKDRFKDVLRYNQITIPVVFLNDRSGNLHSMDAPPSTKTLTTKGMMEYYQHLQKFAAQFLGVDVPAPNEIPFESIKENR